jgi:hypothetical protein
MNLPPLVPGARVLVLWSDGRQYPATVQALAQGYAQVVWDASSTMAWVGIPTLSPLPQSAAPQPAPSAPAPSWQPHPAYARPAPQPQGQQPTPQQGQQVSPQGQQTSTPRPPQAPETAGTPPSVAPPTKQASAAPQPAGEARPPPPVINPAPAREIVVAREVVVTSPEPRPMGEKIMGLPRGLVYEPTGSGSGSGKAFFFLFGFSAASDTDLSMRMTDIDHIGDDVAALRAAGFRVVVDLHGDLAGLSAALTNKHPDADGALTAGVFWGGHGSEDGTIGTFDGDHIAPEKLPVGVPKIGTVKLFVMSACNAGAHQGRWQKAIGSQATVIGWGAPITNQRAIQFLTPDESSSKGFDDLLERHLGVKRVQDDAPLVEVRQLSLEHEDRIATLNLSFDELIAGVGQRMLGQIERGKGGEAYITVRTPPSKDYPEGAALLEQGKSSIKHSLWG